MITFRSRELLPDFFVEQPLPDILTKLLDAALERDVLGTLAILEDGGLVAGDDIGHIRLTENGAPQLADFALLSDDSALTPEEAKEREAARLLAVSQLTSSFRNIKGQKKALQLVLRLLGLTGEIIEYDDIVRGTAPANAPNLEPGQIVILGQVDPAIASNLISATGKTPEQILQELLDLFVWAHVRFNGILLSEKFIWDWDINHSADLPVQFITHLLWADFCTTISLPLHAIDPLTGEVIGIADVGRRVKVDSFDGGLMRHQLTISDPAQGCTDIDGNVVSPWTLGQDGLVVGGQLVCSIADMPGIPAGSGSAPLTLGPCPSGDQWDIGDEGIIVGGTCPEAACVGSVVIQTVTNI